MHPERHFVGIRYPFCQRGIVVAVISLVILLQCTGQSLYSDTSMAKVTIHTIPEGAKVSVGDSSLSTSPTTLEVSTHSSAVLHVQKDGYLSLIDTVHPAPGVDTTVTLQLHQTATVVVASFPDSANLFVNGKLAGHTPMTLSDLSADTLRIALSKERYESSSLSLLPIEGATSNISVRLQSREASIGIFVDPPTSSVFLDDKLIGHGSVTDFRVLSGNHKLTVADESSGRKGELLTTFDADKQYLFSGRLGYHSITRGLLAIVLPGSAQLLDGSYVKGGIMFLGTAALAYYAVQSQLDYRDRLTEYDQSMNAYIAAPTEIEASRRYDDVLARKSDLDKYYVRRTICFSVFAAAYVYTVADALLNHLVSDDLDVAPPNEFITGTGIPLRSQETGVQFKMKIR